MFLLRTYTSFKLRVIMGGRNNPSHYWHAKLGRIWHYVSSTVDVAAKFSWDEKQLENMCRICLFNTDNSEYHHYGYTLSMSIQCGQHWWLHSDVIWRQRSWPTFVQIMACHLLGVKPLPDLMLFSSNKTPMNIFQLIQFEIHRSALKNDSNVVGEMSSIAFRP